MSITRFHEDVETGRVTIISDSSRPYELRRPKGLSAHAAERQFSKRKPRYRRYQGLLVMARTATVRAKKAAQLCPVVAFPIS